MLVLLNLLPVGVVVVLLVYVFWQMTRLPENRPERFHSQTDKKTVVLAGDSITHGQIGDNYVTMLSNRLDMQQFNFVNAGVNSELAWNLLQRVDDIIACKPDIVTILIGTNDARAATSIAEAKDYVKRMNLPQMPDQNWFSESLNKIVTELQERTDANIALISIPPMGEDPNHLAFRKSSEYIKSIQEIANRNGVAYLPLHEKMLNYVKEHNGNPTYPFYQLEIRMFIACFKRYILGKDWDSIGESSGFKLHIDYLHLNTKGASILTNLIEEFIKNS